MANEYKCSFDLFFSPKAPKRTEGALKFDKEIDLQEIEVLCDEELTMEASEDSFCEKERSLSTPEVGNSSENCDAQEPPTKSSKSSTEHFIIYNRRSKEAGRESTNSSTIPSTISCNDAFLAVVKDYLQQVTDPVRLSLLRIQILTFLHKELYPEK